MPKPLRFAIIALLAAAVVYVIYSSMHTAQFRVEVCLTYQGASACRTAEGRTRDEALRAAHDNACAQVTSGVTGTLGCQNTPATRVTWR
ncbi:MAG TPA: hypothetical protein VN709_13395 [Terriglobales bacterium]|nr:hypothetical protein [Terriglobales bacterium]